ncbi:MAG: hypothetical protein ACR2NN_06900 [Bryobacteraceae bacterium]
MDRPKPIGAHRHKAFARPHQIAPIFVYNHSERPWWNVEDKDSAIRVRKLLSIDPQSKGLQDIVLPLLEI